MRKVRKETTHMLCVSKPMYMLLQCTKGITAFKQDGAVATDSEAVVKSICNIAEETFPNKTETEQVLNRTPERGGGRDGHHPGQT